MSTIILTGGGSAGHCTPHLAVLPHLKKYFNKIYYIGSINGIEKDIITQANIPYFGIPCAKLERKLTLKNAIIPFKVHKGIVEAGRILDETNPDVIFSKGGYVSVPTVIAASKRKIPIISHESDITAGIANKIISRYAYKTLTSFPDTVKEFKNGEYVGSPIRNLTPTKTKTEILDSLGFKGKKPILLITGGSLGAAAINETVYKSINKLTEEFDVIHLCGKGNMNKNFSIENYFQIEFVHNVENIFSIADVCVSRAGSNAVFELLSLKKPCVLIPLPKGASRGDQILNAEFFERAGLCVVLNQNVLTPESLSVSVNCAYKNRRNLLKNLENYPLNDSNAKIAKTLFDASKKRNPFLSP